jgi:hypothetical protein
MALHSHHYHHTLDQSIEAEELCYLSRPKKVLAKKNVSRDRLFCNKLTLFWYNMVKYCVNKGLLFHYSLLSPCIVMCKTYLVQ